MVRSRWAAIGAVVAVSLGGGVAWIAQAATSSSEGASSFVPMTPCRLMDTRSGSGNVGPRDTPIGQGESYSLAVHGTNGRCTIPPTATGIATNTTVLGGTAASFLTLYPANVARPGASNLNWVTAQSATPNQVTVGLSPNGHVNVYNDRGSVNVIIDIVGFYEPAAVGGTPGPQGPQGPQGLQGAKGDPGDPATGFTNGEPCIAAAIPGTIVSSYDDGYLHVRCFRNLVTTIAGSTQGFADANGANAQFFQPHDVTVDIAGNLYVADTFNYRIRKIAPNGDVTTLAGDGTPGSVDGDVTNARFSHPTGVAADMTGNIYIADAGSHRIRKIAANGDVTTLAGSTQGFADGNGTNAQFNFPIAVTVDIAGNVYVADHDNHRIRKITANGDVTTLAGSTQGFADGNGANAQFDHPYDVTVDSAGYLYVADLFNYRIRKIAPNGDVTTLAGAGLSGSADGNGTNARFSNPTGVATDITGNIYVAEYGNHRIRKITPNGDVTTIAGSTQGFADGVGANAQFNLPFGVAVDTTGNVYVADQFNHRVRKIN